MLWGRVFARWCSVKPATNCSLPITANLLGSEPGAFFTNHQFTKQHGAKHKSRVCWHGWLSSSGKLPGEQTDEVSPFTSTTLHAQGTTVEAHRWQAEALAEDKPLG